MAVVWAVAAHVVSAGNDTSGWGAALALVPLGVATGIGLWRIPSRLFAALCAFALLTLLILIWPYIKGEVPMLYYAEHLGLYGLMAVVFGRSLLGTKESLVTQMARRVHGGVLSPVQQIYTRKVTLAWCLFFVGMAAVSTGLYWFSTVRVWSVFANLLGGPLIALMFVGEYLWRRIALPPEDHRATMGDAIRAWRTRHSEPDL